jgi:hypothetical protein
MPAPTTYTTTQLAAVNEILGSVGQAPVTVLDQTNPEIAFAFTTLMDISREVQAEGWSFNKEYEYPLTPDSQGNINIPANVLQMDLSDDIANADYDTVIRNGKLYDKINHTFTWDKSKQYKLDVVWYFDFDDLPQVFKDYIVARASTRAATRLVGDTNLSQVLASFEALRRANCMEYECNQGDYTMFGFKQGEGFYNSYKPFKTLAR